jgi:hypothetical protein
MEELWRAPGEAVQSLKGPRPYDWGSLRVVLSSCRKSLCCAVHRDRTQVRKDLAAHLLRGFKNKERRER